MSFSDNLKKARQCAGLTQQQVSDALGVTKSTYCCYETGKRQPDLIKLRRLSLLLCTTCDELLGLVGGNTDCTVTSSEYEQIKLFRSLDAHGQRLIRMILQEETLRMQEHMRETHQHKETDAPVPFRLAIQGTSADSGAYLGPNAFHTVLVRREALPEDAVFGLRVRGSSLEPQYHDRNILIVSEATPQPGDIGVFLREGMGIVRILGYDQLISPNPAYPPIPMDENIHACGTVIGILSPIDIQ